MYFCLSLEVLFGLLINKFGISSDCHLCVAFTPTSGNSVDLYRTLTVDCGLLILIFKNVI